MRPFEGSSPGYSKEGRKYFYRAKFQFTLKVLPNRIKFVFQDDSYDTFILDNWNDIETELKQFDLYQTYKIKKFPKIKEMLETNLDLENISLICVRKHSPWIWETNVKESYLICLTLQWVKVE